MGNFCSPLEVTSERSDVKHFTEKNILHAPLYYLIFMWQSHLYPIMLNHIKYFTWIYLLWWCTTTMQDLDSNFKRDINFFQGIELLFPIKPKIIIKFPTFMTINVRIEFRAYWLCDVLLRPSCYQYIRLAFLLRHHSKP